MTLALPELDVLGDRTIIRVVDLEASHRRNLTNSKHTLRDADTHASAPVRQSVREKNVAERQGFEPWVRLRVQRFSRPSRSTAPAPLRFQIDIMVNQPILASVIALKQPTNST